MITFWEIAAYSVGHLYFLYFVYFYFIYFPFWFKSECHHNARARGDQPSSDDRQKMKFVLMLLRNCESNIILKKNEISTQKMRKPNM